MMSEMDSSGPLLTNYLGNVAMGASKADMDLAFRTFLSKSSELGSCLFISIDVKGWRPGDSRKFFLLHHDTVMGYTQGDHNISFEKVWEGLRYVYRRDGLSIDMEIDEGMVQGWTGRYDCILHSHILLFVTAKLRKKGILTQRGIQGESHDRRCTVLLLLREESYSKGEGDEVQVHRRSNNGSICRTRIDNCQRQDNHLYP